MKKKNSRIGKFSNLDANEVGLVIKLTEDGSLSSSMGVCFAEELNPERADAMLDMMHGILGLIDDCPLMLMAYGAEIRPNESDQLREVFLEAAPELQANVDDFDRKKHSNVIDFSSRKTKQ